MSLQGTYDTGNIFAKILRGEASCHRVHEDAHTLAFLDLFPQARGHTLVIPRHAQARNLLEVDAQTLNHLVLATQRIVRALTAALEPDGVQVFQFNGSAAGQTVFHLHFHVIPRWTGAPIAMHAQKRADDAELASLAVRIAAQLG